MKDKIVWPGDEAVEASRLDIAPECMYSMTFHKDNKDIGRLYWGDGAMKFEGITEQSAQVFFDYLLDILVNPYVKAKLAKSETPMNKGQNAPAPPSG